MSSRFDYLDDIAIRVAKGDTDGVGALSSGERLYVALAANNTVLLKQFGFTIAEALDRLDEDWIAELIARWRRRGDPKNIAPGTE
jgi:hypothetical protein